MCSEKKGKSEIYSQAQMRQMVSVTSCQFAYVSCESERDSGFVSTDFQLTYVFCFTDFLSEFLFRVWGLVRVEVRGGGGFRVRVRVRTSVGG